MGKYILVFYDLNYLCQKTNWAGTGDGEATFCRRVRSEVVLWPDAYWWPLRSKAAAAWQRSAALLTLNMDDRRRVTRWSGTRPSGPQLLKTNMNIVLTLKPLIIRMFYIYVIQCVICFSLSFYIMFMQQVQHNISLYCIYCEYTKMCYNLATTTFFFIQFF